MARSRGGGGRRGSSGGGRRRGGGAGGGGGGGGLEWDDAAFQRGLAAAVGRLKIDTEADLQRMGIRVQNRARQYAPVDTGRLRSSIQHQMGRDSRGPYVDIGTNVEYAPYVEYGTQHQRAQPYLRPALIEVVTGGFRRRG